MIPYFENAFYLSGKSGQPVVSPMWMLYPNTFSVFDNEKQLMIGNDIIFIPATEYGQKYVFVYLPPGIKWYNFYTSRLYNANSEHTVMIEYETCGLFVKQGTIIPLSIVPEGARSTE